MKAKPCILAPVSQSRRAVALIIVLAILLLMSALLVAFMGTVSNEREASRSMTAGFEAKQAYETAVNLAISQIREATKSDDGLVGWASQPGAIHTFGSGSGANMVYKLYTSTLMQQPIAQWKPGTPAESGFDPAAPGTTSPGFVDLNLPIFMPLPGSSTGEVEPHYPIADPRAGLTATGTAASAPGKGIVESFFAANIPHPTLKEIRGASSVPVLQLPMRVRWLYQLKDGSLVAPDITTGVLKGASKENPPVSRLAFWTDDESAKINVNTAGEGTYWDIPLASSSKETGKMKSSSDAHLDYATSGKSNAFSLSQPAAKEYQRYPGHPATTCLSPALRWLFPAKTTTVTDPEYWTDYKFKEAIYRMAPRLTGGYGSTVAATSNEADSEYRQFDRDRLFATLDEYWFRPDRSPISRAGFYRVFTDTSASYIADPKILVDATATPAALEKLRFFLTAVSRAPELNLYGMPRISMWPVHEIDNPLPSASKRTGYDDLMVFCSTIATKPYIFSRANPWSTKYDYETSGAQTRVGASLNTNANRNRDLIEKYLKRITNIPVPATNTAFTATPKYGTVGPGGYTEMDQILIEMFDYIRCTNIVDTGRKDSTSDPTNKYPLAYTLGYGDLTGDSKPNLGSGQVSPTVRYDGNGKPAVKGFGRYDTVSELGLMFYADRTALPVNADGSLEPAPPTNAADALSFRCAILTEFFTPSPGYLGLSEGFAYSIRETEPFIISSTDPAVPFTKQLSLAEDRTNEVNLNFIGVDAYRADSGRFFMATRGLSFPFFYDQVTSSAPAVKDPLRKLFMKPNFANAGTENDYKRYPFFSKRIDLPSKAGVPLPEFKLSKGTLVIDIYPLDVAPAPTALSFYPKAKMDQKIQSITITFPEVILPTPKTGQLPLCDADPASTVRTPNAAKNETASGGIRGVTVPITHPRIYPNEDVVRSMEINDKAKGDTRHVAGLANPPADYFFPSGDSTDYANKNLRIVHNFRSGWGAAYDNAKWGKLTINAPDRARVKSSTYWKVPDVPKSINGVRSPDGSTFGDADRGFAKQMDGPFINKPDEGNTKNDPADDFAGGGGLAYFRGDAGTEVVGDKYFSPNRIIPSPVMFGSLPSGLISKRPWETLLFCPPSSATHKGAVSPADHYLLDLFTMPVVEPFAISEPLSSMGRVNLNVRLAPFGYAKDSTTGRSYIERNTGLHAVLKGMKQFIASNGTYESGHGEKPLQDHYTGDGGDTINTEFRFDIDPTLTIEKAITPRFDVGGNGFFKSATEICDVDLLISDKDALGNANVFTDPSVGALRAAWAADPTNIAKRAAFWQANSMTGDNARERPYAMFYPRLTTKSNVYTVHVWSQSVLKNPNSNTDEWTKFDENRDRITGEYRGSTTIERYLDPNDPALVPASGGAPYDAVDTNAKGLDPYYRFRILSSKRFTMQ